MERQKLLQHMQQMPKENIDVLRRRTEDVLRKNPQLLLPILVQMIAEGHIKTL